MKLNPDSGVSKHPLQTGLTSSLLQKRRPEFSASQRLTSYVSWESTTRRPRTTYIPDTADLVTNSERQHNVN